jgi:hypothetical protein
MRQVRTGGCNLCDLHIDPLRLEKKSRLSAPHTALAASEGGRSQQAQNTDAERRAVEIRLLAERELLQ